MCNGGPTWISVCSPTQREMASAAKPTRWMSIVSAFLGFPLAGKCMITGAVFSFNCRINTNWVSSRFKNAILFEHYLLENVLSFVEIDQREEKLVGEHLLVSERIGHNLVFVQSVPERWKKLVHDRQIAGSREITKNLLADRALPFRGHGGKHNDDRVVSGRGFHQIPVFIAVKTNHSSFRA